MSEGNNGQWFVKTGNKADPEVKKFESKSEAVLTAIEYVDMLEKRGYLDKGCEYRHGKFFMKHENPEMQQVIAEVFQIIYPIGK